MIGSIHLFYLTLLQYPIHFVIGKIWHISDRAYVNNWYKHPVKDNTTAFEIQLLT